MQLKRLSLENFRNYKGNRDIIFSTDKDHNVTIVIAENGAGKTTLTQAFQWCLYGTTELWSALLELNGVSSIIDFTFETPKVFNPNTFLKKLNEVMIMEGIIS